MLYYARQEQSVHETYDQLQGISRNPDVQASSACAGLRLNPKLDCTQPANNGLETRETNTCARKLACRCGHVRDDI